MVINAVAKVVGQTLHVRDLGVKIVRIFIPAPVAQAFHQPRRSVAQVEGNGFGSSLFHIPKNGSVGGVESIRLGRDRQVNHCLGQRQITFRHADEVDGIARGHAQ